jgi:hypothetical protein
MGATLDKLKSTFSDSPGLSSLSGLGGDSAADPLDEVQRSLRGTAKKNESRLRAQQQQLEVAQAQADLEKLFSQENFEEVMSVYFNIRFVMTGFEGFQQTDKQKAILGNLAAASAKLLLKINPEYVALVLLGVNFTGQVFEKEILYAGVKRALVQKRKIAEEKAAAGGNGATS